MSVENSIVLIEQALIRKAIADTSLIHRIPFSLFQSEIAKGVFSAIKNLYNQDVSITVETLTIEANKTININAQTVQSVITDDESQQTKQTLSYLIERLTEEKTKYKIKNELVDSLIEEVHRKDQFNPTLLQEIIREINSEILTLDAAKANLIMTFPEMFDVYEQTLEDRNTGNTFFDTGCSHLNAELTEGFAPQKITTLFGASGVGKSSYALYLVNKQINKQIPSIYISLEMDLISTMDRLIAQRKKIPLTELIPVYGEPIQQDVLDQIQGERKKLAQCTQFRFVEQSGLSISDIDYIIKESKSQMGVDYCVCTIDLITMVRDFNKSESTKANDYEHALNELHNLVRANNCHIVGVVQGRRPSARIQVEEPADVERFRPHIEEIKNSAAFEERSRIILSTFRPRHYVQRLFPDHPELEVMEDIMEVEILKQNMGALHRLNYLFNPNRSLIMPYEHNNDVEDETEIETEEILSDEDVEDHNE